MPTQIGPIQQTTYPLGLRLSATDLANDQLSAQNIGGLAVAGILGAVTAIPNGGPGITPVSFSVTGSSMVVSFGGSIATPAAPTVGQTALGSLGARTEYYKIVLRNANLAWTLPSAETSFAISANNVATVTSPPATTFATAYDVYASSSSGAETLQTTTPITIGTNWTAPSTGITNNGPTVPTTNTTNQTIFCQGRMCDTISPANQTIAAANATNPRIDLICVKFAPGTATSRTNGQVMNPDTSVTNGVTVLFATEVCAPLYVQGTAAATPVTPAIPAGYDVLYQIAVGANVTAILASNITVVPKTFQKLFAALAGSSTSGFTGSTSGVAIVTNQISNPLALLTAYESNGASATMGAILGSQQFTLPKTANNFRVLLDTNADAGMSYGSCLYPPLNSGTPGPFNTGRDASQGSPQYFAHAMTTSAAPLYQRLSETYAGGTSLETMLYTPSLSQGRFRQILIALPLDTGSRQCGYWNNYTTSAGAVSTGAGVAPATPQTVYTQTITLPTGVGSSNYRVFMRMTSTAMSGAGGLAINVNSAGLSVNADQAGTAVTGALAWLNGGSGTSLSCQYSAQYAQGTSLTITALLTSASTTYAYPTLEIVALPLSDYGYAQTTFNLTSNAGLTLAAPQNIGALTFSTPTGAANYLVCLEAAFYSPTAIGITANQQAMSITSGAPSSTFNGFQNFPCDGNSWGQYNGGAVFAGPGIYAEALLGPQTEPRLRTYFVAPGSTSITANALTAQSSQAIRGYINATSYLLV